MSVLARILNILEDDASAMRTFCRIADSLDRIANALEEKSSIKDLDDQLCELVDKRYKARAKEIVDIVKDNANKHDVVQALKKAGIISKASYWKDIKFYIPIFDLVHRQNE